MIRTTTLEIGDEAVLNGNFHPKYLRGAIVKIKKHDRTVWGGLYASTPFESFECEIVRMAHQRRNGRFRPGVTILRIDERWLTKREPV